MSCPSPKRFFQQNLTIQRELLYPLSQSQTSKALEVIREASPILNNSQNFVLLDKLTATDYSETYRAYDFEKKVFVAQRSIHLDSPASWNQANLILRQCWRQRSHSLFSHPLSIEYDEKKHHVKIISELQNTILKDYPLYLWNQESVLLKERIRPYIMQIIQQLTALKQLGIELEGKLMIDPRKIFVEGTSQLLKLYDISDFAIKER